MGHFLENGVFFETKYFFFFSRYFFKQNLVRTFSGPFDTSGSMIPRLFTEILLCDGFCDEEQQQQELGILGLICAKLVKSDNI